MAIILPRERKKGADQTAWMLVYAVVQCSHASNEACIGVLGIQDIFHYRMRSILLPGIWDTVINILVAFRGIEYLCGYLPVFVCLLHEIFGTPIYKPHKFRFSYLSVNSSNSCGV